MRERSRARRGRRTTASAARPGRRAIRRAEAGRPDRRCARASSARDGQNSARPVTAAMAGIRVTPANSITRTEIATDGPRIRNWPNCGQAERRERGDDGQRGRGDDGADRAARRWRRRCGGPHRRAGARAGGRAGTGSSRCRCRRGRR